MGRQHVDTELLDAKLKKLSNGKVSRKIALAGTRAAMTPIARGIRRGITASKASADLKRIARRTVSKRITRATQNENTTAKVGFGVGKQKAAERSGKNSGGKGIAKQNIHWAVAGTEERKLDKTDVAVAGTAATVNHPTGQMPDYFDGVVPAAIASTHGLAFAAAEKKMSQELEKEIGRTS